MKKKNHFFKRKDVLAALSFCLVGMLALAGLFLSNNDNNSISQEEHLVDLDEEPDVDQLAGMVQEELEGKDTTQTKEVGAGQNSVKADQAPELTKEEAQARLDNNNDMDVPEDMMLSEAEEQALPANAGGAVNLSFSEDTKMTWPVNGEVKLDYSMDKSVYFETLDQYKYNPAIIFSSDVNKEVVAAVKGIVEAIDVSEETGVTVTMDIGNGYKAKYGQLKDVPFAIGDVVEEGTTIGYVNEPTKYYVKEGSNLYFQVTKDDSPVNPMIFLKAQ